MVGPIPYSDDLIHTVTDEFRNGKALRTICKERSLVYRKILCHIKKLGYDIKSIKSSNHSKALKYRTRRTHNEYSEFCLDKNIEVMEQYVGTNHKILHKCSTCLYEWMPTPDNVLNGSGCPPCSVKNNALGRSLTHDEYVDKIAISNPTLKLLEPYKGGESKLKFSCLICGYEWMKRQEDVKNGSGCPVCIIGRYGRKKMLESGIWLDSMFEYHCYQELITIFNQDDIEIHKPYEGTNFTCDFYIKPLCLYMEVSNFNTESYYERIYLKHSLVDRFFFANNLKQIKQFFKEVYNV